MRAAPARGRATWGPLCHSAALLQLGCLALLQLARGGAAASSAPQASQRGEVARQSALSSVPTAFAGPRQARSSDGAGQVEHLDEVELHKFKPSTKEPGLTQPRQKACAQAMDQLDHCSSQLIGLGAAGSASLVLLPDSMQQLDSIYCPHFKQTIACIKNQTNCFKPFERQIIAWVLSSTKRMNYKRCKNDHEKARFLKLTNSCLSSMRDPMDECMSSYIASLDAIAEQGSHYHFDASNNALDELERLQEASSGEDVQIQLACCANRRYKQCMLNGAKRMCNKSSDSLRKQLRRTSSNSSQRVARKHLLRSMQDTMDDLRTTLDQMALTGPEFICHHVDEHFCRLNFDLHFTGRSSRHRSIVPAMLKIYANK